MIPNRPPLRPLPTADEPFFNSLHSAATVTVDRVTERRQQVLTTTSLAMRWIGDELRIEFKGWKVRGNVERYIAALPDNRRTR